MGNNQALDETRQNEIRQENEVRKQKAIEKIPYWIEEGKKLIYPERYDEWENYIKNENYDLYYGEDLDYALQIMQAIESDIPMEQIAETFNFQGFSGGSMESARNIVLTFSSKGPEFYAETSSNMLTENEMEFINKKISENDYLAEINGIIQR